MDFVRPEIKAMGGYVPGEQPKGNEAVKLNTNENPYRASEKVYAAMRQAGEVGLSRYPNAMGQPFREAAAELFDLTPDWFLCGNGSDDILTILTRTFVGAGELVRMACPSYILYKSLAEIQGAACEEIRFRDDWTLPPYFGLPADASSPDSPLRTPAPPLRLVFLPNPNSPSGTMIPQEQIAAFAKTLPCPLVVDEAYADFAPSHCVELVKSNPNIIVTRTLSKAYSLAGLRFGYLIAHPDLVYELAKVKDSYNCDAVSIAGATAALRDQAWRQENLKKILANRAVLTQRMRELGFLVPDSCANFTWNVHRDKNVSHKAIYEFLKRHGYLVRYMNYAGWGDGLRISVGTEEQTRACLALVERALNETEPVVTAHNKQ
ncbi:MAG: histidinol-phosphate transaminase [Planctomycetia bacterium]|nr:histidinol-phosphate transaminase [Planctomycetia bacterium]